MCPLRKITQFCMNIIGEQDASVGNKSLQISAQFSQTLQSPLY